MRSVGILKFGVVLMSILVPQIVKSHIRREINSLIVKYSPQLYLDSLFSKTDICSLNVKNTNA